MQDIYNWRQEIKSMVINMLQNLSHSYSSHNNNIKCEDSIIKCMCLNRFIMLLNWMMFHHLWFSAILILYLYRCIASFN